MGNRNSNNIMNNQSSSPLQSKRDPELYKSNKSYDSDLQASKENKESKPFFNPSYLGFASVAGPTYICAPPSERRARQIPKRNIVRTKPKNPESSNRYLSLNPFLFVIFSAVVLLQYNIYNMFFICLFVAIPKKLPSM